MTGSADALAFASDDGALLGVLLAGDPGDPSVTPLAVVRARDGGVAGAGAELRVARAGASWTVSSDDGRLAGTLTATPGDGGRCAVEGEFELDGRGVAISASGVTDTRPEPVPGGIGRWLAVNLGGEVALGLHAHSLPKARSHADESISCWVLDAGGASELVADPRLSTTYDGDGQPLRAGLELWMDEEAEFPRRAAGESVGSVSLETPDARWDVTFLAWTMEGRGGLGPYVVVRGSR